MRLFILSLLIMTQLSCITAKQQKTMLNGYRTDLTSALNDDIKTDQKIDILGESLVDMMKQSLRFKSSIKAGKFVKKYGEQNADIITEIVDEIQSSMSSNPMGQMGLMMSLMQKPYMKELIELIPQFEQKFKRIAWVAKMMGKVGKPLGMLNGGSKSGGLNLGDLIGSEE